MDTVKGCVLFSTCCSSSDGADNIIKEILKVDTLSDGSTLIDDITAYSWSIDNKYYQADVNLCSCPRRTIGDRQFADSVHAIVLHFDANDKCSFDIVRAWLPFVELIDPSVRILACNVCNDTTDATFATVQSWCIEHSFELVELVIEEEDDDEDLCDVVGVARIRSALEAHSWPNLTLKESSSRSTYIESLMVQAADMTRDTQSHDVTNTRTQNGDISKSCDSCEGDSEPLTEELNKLAVTNDSGSSVAEFGDFQGLGESKREENVVIANIEGSLGIDGADDESALLAALGNDDPSSESFEVMFARLQHMKNKADKLGDEERKAYAEKVALTFWRAVGGDESEVAGLSDDDD